MVINFVEENYSNALKLFLPLHNGEKILIKNFGLLGLFSKDMMECMIHFEMKDYEYVNYRFKSIERRFKDFLIDPANFRDKTFLLLFKRLNRNLDLLTDPDFITQVDQFIAMKPIIEPGDLEFLSYNAWLKAKVDNRRYYDVFLEMVR